MRVVLKVFVAICAVFGILIITFIITFLWHLNEQKEAFKPYISYTGLVNLANGCDDYKKQYGMWPDKIEQLRQLRPDLGASATDAYNNSVVLVPYNEAIGYGELISYGRDGKPGGDNKFDQDIVIRFPPEMEANTNWNTQVGARFKNPAKL